jgi:hypothetical protein
MHCPYGAYAVTFTEWFILAYWGRATSQGHDNNTKNWHPDLHNVSVITVLLRHKVIRGLGWQCAWQGEGRLHDGRGEGVHDTLYFPRTRTDESRMHFSFSSSSGSIFLFFILCGHLHRGSQTKPCHRVPTPPPPSSTRSEGRVEIIRTRKLPTPPHWGRRAI